MYKFLLVGLFLFLSTACGARGTCACAPPSLGLFADEELRVTVLARNAPGETAGIQIGDRLLSIRSAKPYPEIGISSDPIPFTNSGAASDLIYYTAPRVVNIPCCPQHGLPLIVQIERGDQTLEVKITSGHPISLPDKPAPIRTNAAGSPLSLIPTPIPTPMPTPTNVPTGWKYF